MPHPYTTTIPGLVGTIRQLRATFPASVTAETLKKWSIASNNEGPVLVVLRFLKLIDDEGKKIAETAKVFVEHDDAVFAKRFEDLVRAAYSDLFDTWGEGAWTLDKNKLIGFFRSADESSSRVGQSQAATFTALAALAGHGQPPATGAESPPSRPRAAPKIPKATPPTAPPPKSPPTPDAKGHGPAITLRVEINLPVTDDQAVYDSIFKSIKAHLIDV